MSLVSFPLFSTLFSFPTQFHAKKTDHSYLRGQHPQIKQFLHQG